MSDDDRVDRYLTILILKRRGIPTWAIAERFGVGQKRIRQILATAERMLSLPVFSK